MERVPRNYDALRQAHQQALDALNDHIEQKQSPGRESSVDGPSPQKENIRQAEKEAADEVTRRAVPERPDSHAADRPGWTGRGDMPSQQASAMEWVKANDAARREQHGAALDALNQHIENRGNQTPEQDQDVGRKPDIERDI